MRRFLIAALMAAGPALAGELVAKVGDNTLRLTQQPCPPSVLKVIPEGHRGPFRRALVVLNGKEWDACHMLRPDGAVLIVYSDGDMGLVPVKLFKEDVGV